MISFIIPAYNEENRIYKTLVELTSYLNKFFKDYEIICAVDGTDETAQIVRKFMLKNHRVKLLESKKRLGKGRALQKGVVKSKGEKVIIIDADLPVPLNSIKDVNQLLEDYDVVNAKKLYHNYPFYRRITRAAFILTQKILFPNLGVSETQGGFKGFTKVAAKNIFRSLKISGFASDVEILVRAKRMDFKIKDYPVKFTYKKDSKVNPLTDSLLMLKDIIAYKLYEFKHQNF